MKMMVICKVFFKIMVNILLVFRSLCSELIDVST